MLSNSTMIVFRRFRDPAEAMGFAQKLNEHGVQSQIIDNSPALDITFFANHSQDEVQLLIKAEDQSKADEVLTLEAEELIKDISPEHYLFQFDNSELYDILKKYDEWNMLDYKLAQKILATRGEILTPSFLSELKAKRDEELNRKEKAGTITLFLGYLLSLFGGIGGIFIGIYLVVTKKTLTNGNKTNYYQRSDRIHGVVIIILSVFMIILWTVLSVT